MTDELLTYIKIKALNASFYCSDIDNNAINIDDLWDILEDRTIK